MKESKKIDNLNEDVDKETEKRFNEELNEIKEKLNSEKLSDEFKANLQVKLQEELNKTEDSSKGKIFNFPTITRKLAGICACFVFLFSTCFVFADDIENVILELFCNTDRIIAKAIEEGNYKDIEMDYVEDQGISIKVDYVVVENDNLYIAFNVLKEENFDKVLFDEIDIKDQNDTYIYTREGNDENSRLVLEEKNINLNNSIVIYKLTNILTDLSELNCLKIKIGKINIVKNKTNINMNGEWNININI